MRAQAALATYDDLLALPEGTRGEVVAGELHLHPSPRPRHARTQRALASFIGRPFDDDDGRGGPGGWWILAEVDVRLSPHDIVRPDLAGWRRARLGAAPWDTLPSWGDGDVARAPPFAAIELEIGRLFVPAADDRSDPGRP